MNATTTSCRQVHDLWQLRDAGQPIDGRGQRLIEEHLSCCERCRLEQQVVDDAAFDGTAAPASQHDDLSHRRFVDAVLAASNARPKHQAPLAFRRFAIAVGVAAAVVTGVLWLGQREEVRSPSTPPLAAIATVDDARYLALSGEVSGPEGALTLESAVALPGKLCTGQGQASFALDPGTRIAVLASSCVALTRQKSGAVELALESGAVVVDIDPTDKPSPALSVTTRMGKVLVTGTAFAASDTGEETWVHVYRGSVVLAPTGEASSRKQVRAGQSSDFTIVTAEPASTEADTRNRAALKTLAALASSNDAATLSIESLPAGAEVQVNAVSIGLTPVLARFPEGRLELSLAQGGITVIREVVEARSRETVRRTFDLQEPIAAKEPAATSPEPDRGTRPRRPASLPAASGAEPPPDTAADILEAAQLLRAGRQPGLAAEKYQELLRLYPQSPEALAGSVSLAELYLDRLGRPAEALRLFDQFLARAGRHSLRPEAELGRAKAYRALGQTAQERAALETFLASYPSTLQADTVRARLAEIPR